MVDNPKMTLAKQLAYFKALNLPCAALINTGANSVQAWVKIGADNQEEYDERVDFLFSTLASQGFQVDSSNRNPSMMVRMPGVLRGGKQQYLISLEQGAKNFAEWKQWVEYSLDGKPLIELASDSEEAPKKDEVLIQNMLQAGEFFLFTAPPKCGKSMALMDLGLSLCYGEEWFGNATTMSDVLFINFELTKAVFLNRLTNPAYTKLQSCVTVEYAMGIKKSIISYQDTQFDSPYNTYMYPGLPVGPICCPGKDSVEATIHHADNNYYYFQSDQNGHLYFAETFEEHAAIQKEVQADWKGEVIENYNE